MRRVVVLASAAVLLALILLTTVFLTSDAPPPTPVDDGKFYVGVTYCGNATAEAKQLIDKVKNYTNLFILQSGTLQNDRAAIYEIGDYAVESGLDYITFFGGGSGWLMLSWLSSYDGRWGEHFLGFYFSDERGGKMLEYEMHFYDSKTKSNFFKLDNGSILDYRIDQNTNVTYKLDGTIVAKSGYPTIHSEKYNITTYYSNGTITFSTYQESGSSSSTIVEDASSLPYTYEQLLNARPFQSYDEAAERFIDSLDDMYQIVPSNQTVKTFTSDYVLYWFDYLSGYDVVLAQLGWNHSVTKDIALVRGAADMQGKLWGVIITWKYTQQPYLASGEEIYEQMRTSYENGAKYIVIFNYAENMTSPYGTLKEEHFQALERFWNEVVQNPFVAHGGVRAEAAFVLPRNCGWGLRNVNDTVWGLWEPTAEYQQFWPRLQDALARYGQRTDIVIDDPAYPVAGKYSHIIYWNETS